MYALDSDGSLVDHLQIKGTVTYEVAERFLSAKLDAVDPKPTLHLVKEERPAIRAEKVSPAVLLALHGLIRPQRPLS